MNELNIIHESALRIEEKDLIEDKINQIIQQYGNNRAEINRMTLDCVSALTAGKARSAELSNRGFFKRLWGSITGSNRALQNEINRNYSVAQYASQRCLEKLAEQNLMSFELISTVNAKLNAMMVNIKNDFVEMNSEIGSIYEILGIFFKQSRSELLTLKNDVEDLKKRATILEWEAAIEYQLFDGKEYDSLSRTGKIICLVRDFYQITKGDWSENDLLLFKAALGNVDLNPRDKISYAEFFDGLIKTPILLNELFKEININNVDPIYTVILGTGEKCKLLTIDENYQINVFMNIMEEHDVSLSKEGLIQKILEKYMDNTCMENIQAENTIYDFCLELLYNIWQAKHYVGNQDDIVDRLDKLGKCVDIYRQQSFFENEVKSGNGRAAYYLSLAFNGEKQKNILEAGMEIGDVLCKCCYFRLFGGEFTKDDYDAIYNLATNGDYIAQNELYWLMRIGYEGLVDKNEYEAIEWLKKSTSQDYVVAQNDLGDCYYEGIGVEKDYEEALNCYRKAAEQGYATAQYNLGQCYYEGEGVEQDYRTAAKWYQKAAEQGNAVAQYNLGECYYNGIGVNQDYKEAVACYKKAGEQGDSKAQYILGNCYYYGIGVEQNYYDAADWYQKAANGGFVKAQLCLGDCYYSGEGKEQNYEEAIRWYKKASEHDIKGRYYSEAINWYKKTLQQDANHRWPTNWKLLRVDTDDFNISSDYTDNQSIELIKKYRDYACQVFDALVSFFPFGNPKRGTRLIAYYRNFIKASEYAINTDGEISAEMFRYINRWFESVRIHTLNDDLKANCNEKLSGLSGCAEFIMSYKKFTAADFTFMKEFFDEALLFDMDEKELVKEKFSEFVSDTIIPTARRASLKCDPLHTELVNGAWVRVVDGSIMPTEEIKKRGGTIEDVHITEEYAQWCKNHGNYEIGRIAK